MDWTCPVSLPSIWSDGWLDKRQVNKTQTDSYKPSPSVYSGRYHDKSMATPNCAENRLAIIIIQSVKSSP